MCYKQKRKVVSLNLAHPVGATAGNNKSDVHCNHIKTKGRPMFLLEPSHCVLTAYMLQPDLRLVIRLVLVLKFCFVLMKIRFDVLNIRYNCSA